MKIYTKIHNYLNSRSQRSQIVVKNAVSSFIIKIITYIIDFIKIPIYLSFLDKEHYGVFLTIASIIGWTNQFDFGLGTGLRYSLTKSLSLKDYKKSKELISTAYISMSSIMAIVVLLGIPLVIFLDWGHILNCNFIEEQTLILCVCMVFIVFILQYVLDLISIVLQSDQRTAFSSLFKPLANVITLILILLLRSHAYNSLTLACITMTLPTVVILVIANIFLFNTKYKVIRPSFNFFRTDCIKDIYSLGLKFFISRGSALVVFGSSSFLISHFINPGEAAVYNTAWAFFGIIVTINNMVLQPMISAVTDAYVKKEENWIKNTYRKIRYYSLILTMGSIMLLCISPLFFKLWLGDQMHIPLNLSIIMTIYFICNIWITPYLNFLAGVGKMNVMLLLSIFKIIVFFPIAISMIKLNGTIGLVLSIIFINTLPNMIIGIIQYNKLICHKADGIWNK